MPLPEDPHYLLFEATQIDESYMAVHENIRNDFVREVAKTFHTSIGRVAALAGMPLTISFFNYRLGRASASIPEVSGDPYADARLEIVDGIGTERFGAFFETMNALPSDDEIWRVGSTLMGYVFRPSDPKDATIIDVGVESIFYAMVLNAYAAFETLATDLWVATVNRYPKLYKQIKGDSALKSITLSELEHHHFDLRERMGDVLKSAEKVSFQRLANIQETYEHIFGRPPEGCTVFKDNPDLRRTEKTRHITPIAGGS